MNLSRIQKQTQRHREQICGCQGVGIVEGWIRSLELAVQTTVHKMDKQQGPAV